MKKKQNLFLLILLSLFLLFGMQISVSAAVRSGSYTYTSATTGYYPNTGALVPLPCYVYNLTTGKSTRIS